MTAPFTILFCCLALAGGDTEAVRDGSTTQFLTGGKLTAQLNRPISASWRQVGLRNVLRKISANRSIAILLDRRIDPTRELAIDLNDRAVLAGLEEIASRLDASISLVSNTVFVGPADRTPWLRTLVRLRADELFGAAASLPAGRQFELMRRQDIHWNDLDRPVDLIRQIADRYKLEVQGLNQIPHDLWAGATLPAVNSYEALSLILFQFDMTFHWTDGAKRIRMVPIPNEISIEKTYRPRGAPQLAAKRWRKQIAGLNAIAAGRKIVVRGTVEQHEAVEALLHPNRKRNRKRKPIRTIPLNKREFTLQQRASAGALMKTLQTSGIVFKYDPQALSAAGIDLNEKIRMDVKNVSAEEFFQAMCKPLGLTFTIDGVTVTLAPK